MVQTVRENDSQVVQLQVRLKRIETILTRAASCSSSVTSIVDEIVLILGSDKDGKGLLGYFARYQESQTSSSVFQYAKRMIRGTRISKELENYNSMLDRVLQDLDVSVGLSTNRKLDEVVQALQDSNKVGTSGKTTASPSTHTSTTALESMYEMDPLPLNYTDHRCVLGRGAFATTYRVRSRHDYQLYAMKQVSSTTLSTAGIRIQSIQNEVQVLIQLTHNNIIRYFISFESSDKRLFQIIMELADGGSLADKIPPSTSTSLIDIKKWLDQCLSALHYLHIEKHILHRDIKPENILLTSRGDVKIADLGLAYTMGQRSTIGTTTMTGAQSAIGTMMYASYEKAHGLNYDNKDDIWGLGCVFTELLTRKRLSEWGGALYEYTQNDVIVRKQNILSSCATICGSQYGAMYQCVEKALVQEAKSRYDANRLKALLSSTVSPTLPPPTTTVSKFKATNETLKEAVKAWCSSTDHANALQRYGHISTWDTSDVTSMKELFYVQREFNDNIENWNVSKVTDMQLMFGYCSIFNQPLDKWNVSNVTTMYMMFSEAFAFNQPLNRWNVSNVKNISWLFKNCNNFNQSLHSWNVSNVTDMSYMFGCTTDAGKFNQPLNSWRVDNVLNMAYMFDNQPLFNQSLANWNVGNVKNMEGMFRGAKGFNQSLNNWNVSNVTNMNYMLCNCSVFNQPLDRWNVSNVQKMFFMFTHSVTFNQPLNTWNVMNVREMGHTFSCATNFNQPLDRWNVQNVTTMIGMFYNATNFDQPLNSWNVCNVTDMSQMFLKTKFNQPINNWNVSNVQSMALMFSETTQFNQPLDRWNVQKVANMSYMFQKAAKFNQSLNNWNVSSVVDMQYMFHGTAFNQPLNNWNVCNVIKMSGMFMDASRFNQPLDRWNVSKVLYMSSLFTNASNFNQPLTNWNVSSVQYMNLSMFDGAVNFSFLSELKSKWPRLK